MPFQSGMVFYDLEWTGNELLQIGAVCLNSAFERTILTETDIHPKVTAAINVRTQWTPEMHRVVYDCHSQKILKTFSPHEALLDFLNWLKLIMLQYGQVLLISYGNADIPMLYQSFSEFSMEDEFLSTISQFLDLQVYFKQHFPGTPYGLSALVNLIGNKNLYRFHNALEDSRATQDVFFKLHQMSKVSRSTPLFKISASETFAPFTTVRLNCMSFSIESKQMSFLEDQIEHKNAATDMKQLKEYSSDEWFGFFSSLPLFKKVDPPPCYMFFMKGWVIDHSVILNDQGMARSRVEILCQIVDSFIPLQFHPDNNSTFQRKKLLLEHGADKIDFGSAVVARIQIKKNKDPRVMFIMDRVGEKLLPEELSKIYKTAVKKI